MRNKRNWFAVDTDGLAQLQAGRPKWHIVRELVQNAFDEEVTTVCVDIRRNGRSTDIVVADDCPEGFKDLTDAFTLFGETHKRSDPTKRGRFNLGEKQAIAQARQARIQTTKGTVVFENRGRRTERAKRESGSEITLTLTCNQQEHDEMLKQARRFVPPDGVVYMVSKWLVKPLPIAKTLSGKVLKTVILKDGELTQEFRSTDLRLYEPNGDGTWLYEMGIPVIPIECRWSVDVQQKIPLAMDRDSVRDGYLADVYAQILNETIAELPTEQASESWVRAGAGHFDIKHEVTKELLRKRYGEKIAMVTPGDERSNSEALANGYRVIHSNDLSGPEREQIAAAGGLPSTQSLFGLTPGNAKPIEPTVDMLRVAELTRRIARRCLGIGVEVEFIELPGSAGIAWYGGRALKFTVNLLPADFFSEPTAPRVIDLIIHELGHEHGHHTDRAYLDTLTRLGGELTSMALKEPEFFNV